MMTEPTLATLLNIDQTVTPPRIAASGDWVLAQYAHLEPAISALQPQLLSNAVFDLSQLGELDTAGAALLVKLMGEQKVLELERIAPTLPPERRILLQTVRAALHDYVASPGQHQPGIVTELLANIGQSVERFWQNLVALIGFIGLTMEALFVTYHRVADLYGRCGNCFPGINGTLHFRCQYIYRSAGGVFIPARICRAAGSNTDGRANRQCLHCTDWPDEGQ